MVKFKQLTTDCLVDVRERRVMVIMEHTCLRVFEHGTDAALVMMVSGEHFRFYVLSFSQRSEPFYHLSSASSAVKSLTLNLNQT